jgi:ParB family chromosome partitioning protein
MTTRKISDITVGERHRKEMGDLDALAASIADIGLLNPITIAPDGTLLAGSRRLAACKKLGWDKVPVRIMEGTE